MKNYVYTLLLCALCSIAYGRTYVTPHNVRVNNSTISARLLNQRHAHTWKKYQLCYLPKAFLRWNLNARLQLIRDIEHGKFPKTGISPAHNAMIATYGATQKNSAFSLNNAAKGLGFLPKQNKLPQIIKLLQQNMHQPMPIKLKLLTKLYNNFHYYFDPQALVSLELYSTPKKYTETFANLLQNPTAVITFLAIPSYKFKTIAQLLDPHNPQLNPQEKQITKYVNLMHQYIHHDNKKYIAVVYYVIEAYDETPNTGKGRRIDHA